MNNPLTFDAPTTREAGLERLAAFLPHAGWDYAARRNFDRPGSTARLSPYLRHRLITEAEVVGAVIDRHGPKAVEKFIQEVFWRSYLKGWLEMRPDGWSAYRTDLRAALNRLQTEAGLRADVEAACMGRTGIACFDHWAQELAQTGFLHNHARMWFASIWIFTLRLPWVLGADLFLRLLLDGDAASNTLSWRWVAGLQTRGKHYLATAENIARFTEGQFNPTGQLIENAAPLEGKDHHRPRELPSPVTPLRGVRTGVLLHDEDLSLNAFEQIKVWPALEQNLGSHLVRGTGAASPQGNDLSCIAVAALNASANRSPLKVSTRVQDFANVALDDAARRLGVTTTPVTTATRIAEWAENHDLQQIVTPHAPVGPVAEIVADPALDHLRFAQIRSEWDSVCWPHATHGFFRFRKQIPGLIDRLIRQ